MGKRRRRLSADAHCRQSGGGRAFSPTRRWRAGRPAAASPALIPAPPVRYGT